MDNPSMAIDESHTDLEHIKELLLQVIESNKQISHSWRAHHEETHIHEHEAREKAENAVNARLEGMNELRAQINNERGLFLLRDQYNERHEALVQRVSNEVERINARITSELERQSQRVQLLIEALDRRVTEVERLETVQSTKNEYTMAQATAARQRMALLLTALSVGIAILTNFLFRSL